MLAERTFLLLLLALVLELSLTPAHQSRSGDHGSAPASTLAPRRARRGRWPPAALQDPGKAGECPTGRSGAHQPLRLYCLSDRSCPGAEKCCRSRGVRTCLHPTAESPGYCPRTNGATGESCTTGCHNDTACAPGEKCCTRGCCAHCLRPEPAKPGSCPRRLARRRDAACPNRCADDRDCPGDLKCCFSGCGLACIPPGTGIRHAAVKPGACPVVLRGSLGPCLELCDTDRDCPGAAKCCTTGCGHVCKTATEARPGLCPPEADGDGKAQCHLLCMQDKDCPPGQKCCLRGCGRACVPLLQGKPHRQAKTPESLDAEASP
ncbi:WAP four-disulfide core domain protein 3-like [Heliangelus exortis]|uniref:WAP four-disulfide core domain protein 3-like n=1 Tax=Heliangelus exortis TaxID=472823 RepID=UPI003A907B36